MSLIYGVYEVVDSCFFKGVTYNPDLIINLIKWINCSYHNLFHQCLHINLHSTQSAAFASYNRRDTLANNGNALQ